MVGDLRGGADVSTDWTGFALDEDSAPSVSSQICSAVKDIG